MGIVNATPDSFYAASRAPSAEAAVRRGLELVEEGAQLLDVGGESTRPGSAPVPAEEQMRRVLPAIEALAKRAGVPVSVDTSSAAVALRALDCGATMLNDVTALRGDPGMALAARRYPRVALMHMRGSPGTMQEAPRYGDVVAELLEFFRERLAAFASAGGDPGSVLLDPGIGFGKSTEHNLEILRRLEQFRSLGRPLLLGVSRKSFLGRLLGGEPSPLPPEERLEGSLAVACRALDAGVEWLRVHDVRATRRALLAYAAVRAPVLAAA